LKVYDVLGRETAMLIDEYLMGGEHRVQWTADRVASGTYFIQLDFEHFSETQKVLMQK
jgi:hypothetical protein